MDLSFYLSWVFCDAPPPWALSVCCSHNSFESCSVSRIPLTWRCRQHITKRRLIVFKCQLEDIEEGKHTEKKKAFTPSGWRPSVLGETWIVGRRGKPNLCGVLPNQRKLEIFPSQKSLNLCAPREKRLRRWSLCPPVLRNLLQVTTFHKAVSAAAPQRSLLVSLSHLYIYSFICIFPRLSHFLKTNILFNVMNL